MYLGWRICKNYEISTKIHQNRPKSIKIDQNQIRSSKSLVKTDHQNPSKSIKTDHHNPPKSIKNDQNWPKSNKINPSKSIKIDQNHKRPSKSDQNRSSKPTKIDQNQAESTKIDYKIHQNRPISSKPIIKIRPKPIIKIRLSPSTKINQNRTRSTKINQNHLSSTSKTTPISRAQKHHLRVSSLFGLDSARSPNTLQNEWSYFDRVIACVSKVVGQMRMNFSMFFQKFIMNESTTNFSR